MTPTFDENEHAEQVFNDRLAGRYFAIWDNYPIQRYTNAEQQGLMAATIDEGADVLVLGVGGGRELAPLSARGCAITAVDVSAEMLRIAKERNPDGQITWVQANVAALPETLPQFDAVVAFGGVMNYVIDPPAVLAVAHRRLRPGGHILFDSFNSEYPNERSLIEKNGRVRRAYDLASLESMLGDAGFRGVRIHPLRFFSDLLPPDVNANGDHPHRPVLMKLLEMETQLREVLAPTQAKILTLVADA